MGTLLRLYRGEIRYTVLSVLVRIEAFKYPFILIILTKRAYPAHKIHGNEKMETKNETKNGEEMVNELIETIREHERMGLLTTAQANKCIKVLL